MCELLKKCKDCKLEKPLSSYASHKGMKDGLKAYCRDCNHIRTSKWQKENKEKCAESSKAYRERNPEKFKKANQKTKLRLLYGITVEQYNEKLLSQNSVCDICGNPETVSKRGKLYDLCVDHNHDTGQVRGLLCRNCNTAIGMLGDNSNTVLKAFNYLEKWN